MPRRRSGKKIDFVHWTPFTGGADALAAGTVATTLLAAQHDPETLLRIRGEVTVGIDATQAPGGRVLVSVGIILVPEGTGTTVLWSPFTDGDAPWIWYETVVLGYDEMVTDVIAVQALLGARRVIDNKAMRIIRNQELQLVWENTTLTTAMAINGHVGGRTLSGT